MNENSLKKQIIDDLLQVLRLRKLAKQLQYTKRKERKEYDSGGTMKSNQFYASNNIKLLQKNQYDTLRALHDLWQYNPFLFSVTDREKIISEINTLKIDYSSKKNIFNDMKFIKNCYEYIVKDDTVYLLVSCYKYYDELKIVTFNNKSEEVKIGTYGDARNLLINALKKFTINEKITLNSIDKNQILSICSLFKNQIDHCLIFDSKQWRIYKYRGNHCEEVKNFGTSGFLSVILSFPLSQFPEIEEYRKNIIRETKQIVLYSDKFLLTLDTKRASIQQYDNLLLTDNNLGSWDLFCNTQEHSNSAWYRPAALEESFESRDPRKDIQKSSAVAIDFGTTSTVVAVKGSKGQSKLLRIGVQNMQEAVQAKHFENPTVLGVENFDNFMKDWTACPYKPYTKWADLQCSHQAKAELADKMQSGLVHLKTWARRKVSDNPLRLTDQNGNEFVVKIPEDLTGTLEENFSTAKFNPIEVYAYLLGLNLNNQLIEGGKIYTTYYMTFPVKFDRETKERILTSFRRGLLRSLPPTLIYAEGWNEKSFTVEEHANEPTAYAAAVLPLLPADEEETVTEKNADRNDTDAVYAAESPCAVPGKKKIEYIKATQGGVPFGGFDFGSGTADFSFGLYRLPDAEESADYGWEQVLDILDSSGDENLGGEHLVQLLAFNVIRKNASILLENGIAFIKPLEYEHFSGDELLFSYSGAARINMAKLCEQLRPIWENGELDKEEREKEAISETFISSSREIKANISLKIDIEELQQILIQRIEKGVEAFFTTFRQAFKRYNIAPQSLHIILAGNSCKSPYVQEAFERKKQSILVTPNTNDKIIIHKPLLPNPDKPESVTLKTGVALGLLKTLDGEPVGIRVRYSADNETFFNYTVGMLQEDKLNPTLIRNSAYNEWKMLAKVFKHGKCKILYSNSPMAIEKTLSRDECTEELIDFGKENFGKMIFICPSSPTEISIALSKDEDPANIDRDSIRKLELK